jgi:hypothetical protein
MCRCVVSSVRTAFNENCSLASDVINGTQRRDDDNTS